MSLLAMLAVGCLTLSFPGDFEKLDELAQRAVSADPCVAGEAAVELRALGPRGLDALLAAHDSEIRAHRSAHPLPVLDGARFDKSDEKWRRISAALDVVGAQRDNHAAGLYWYTDLDEAIRVARSENKPILSLRLLGKLTDELSCANSRFFRSTLYANEAVSRRLRKDFILHWESERPVPRVTIDFGDGRKLERTLTGNSIHYVLSPMGRPLDAIPGLYGPGAFLRRLEQGLDCVQRWLAASDSEREQVLSLWHAEKRDETFAAWRADLARCGEDADSIPGNDVETLERFTSEDAWRRIAALHAEDAMLDASSESLITEHGTLRARNGNFSTVGKGLVESPILRQLRNLSGSIALDSVRNEYQFHTRIHEWFAERDHLTRQLKLLNGRVYDQLFLTPRNDPWLGLVPPDVYSGIRETGK